MNITSYHLRIARYCALKKKKKKYTARLTCKRCGVGLNLGMFRFVLFDLIFFWGVMLSCRRVCAGKLISAPKCVLTHVQVLEESDGHVQ